jgi:ubiquinone/menaquinone biosynthesis C-methylase UbiE
MTTPYDRIAAWYDALVRSDSLAGSGMLHCLFDLVGEVDGLRICDLACGQGHITRELSRRGAQVVGVDLSSELIQIARRDETVEPLGIIYVIDDAQTLGTLPDEDFDGVVCNLALMDIPELESTFRAVWRILRPAGWFVFTITHPCFEAPHAQWRTAADGTISREIVTYFAEGFWRSTNPQGVRGQVGAYHRTLTTYANTLIQSGFAIERFAEPQATGAVHVPGYRIVPPWLQMRCRKVLAGKATQQQRGV